MLTVNCSGCSILVSMSAETAATNPVCPRCDSPLVLTLPDPPKPLTVEYQPETEPEEEEEEESDYDPRGDRRRRDRRKWAKQKTLIKLALIVLCVVGIVVGIQVGMERARVIEQDKTKSR